MMMTLTPIHILQRQKDEENKRNEQKMDFGSMNFTNHTKVASNNITYNQKHQQSMTDALAKVRESKVTHEDTTQIIRPNTSGFHK